MLRKNHCHSINRSLSPLFSPSFCLHLFFWALSFRLQYYFPCMLLGSRRWLRARTVTCGRQTPSLICFDSWIPNQRVAAPQKDPQTHGSDWLPGVVMSILTVPLPHSQWHVVVVRVWGQGCKKPTMCKTSGGWVKTILLSNDTKWARSFSAFPLWTWEERVEKWNKRARCKYFTVTWFISAWQTRLYSTVYLKSRAFPKSL